MKRTPARGVKQNVKPLAYKQWEDDSTSDRVPVEECAGEWLVVAWLRRFPPEP